MNDNNKQIKNGKNNNEIFLENFFKIEEYFSLEDYGNYLLAANTLGTNLNNSNSQMIRVMFEVDKKCKEESIEKKNIEKIYTHIKIYNSNEDNFINIYIKNGENENVENYILTRINSMKYFKSIINNKLGIKEYPLITYFLEKKRMII